ncbi:ABC transporter ATP-binding protein [Micromonospora sp. NPDC005206]|uniref:ABC transporter ATP-binding protein n=1 Tax=Micromonospora sp. NPDC005206 TaxID=3157022 RepID=UPI0033B8D2A6
MTHATNLGESKPLLLDVRGLRTTLHTLGGPITVVDGVDLVLPAASTLGVAGESGSGKSMLARSLMSLLPVRGEVTSDHFLFNGQAVDPQSPGSRVLWGPEIAMVFQDPMTALNPVRTIGAQLTDTLRIHERLGKEKARGRAADLLGRVGIPSPRSRLDVYPHEMSGGMRQRVMIAIAISCSPRLLIADEPTTGLDVTVQRQILALLRRLKDEEDMAMILISHDVAMLADEVDAVNIMYAGRTVETVTASQLHDHDVRHRYSEALLLAHPDINAEPGVALEGIPGSPPSFAALPAGCRFAARCAHAEEICRLDEPTLGPDQGARTYACHFPAHAVASKWPELQEQL